MDRLTEKTIGCFKYDLQDFKHKPNEFNDYDAFYAYNMAIKRLGELEDIMQIIHETLDLADEQRNKCKDYNELAISNGLALGKIGVLVNHVYEK
jgi:hypothetical protein